MPELDNVCPVNAYSVETSMANSTRTSARVDDFNAVYNAHFTSVYRMLARFGVSMALLDDATQEVFVKAWRRRTEFQKRSSTRTWLLGIAINTAYDFRKHEARQLRKHEASRDAVGANAARSAEELRNEAARLNALVEVLDQLPKLQREAFVLFELEQMNAESVAECLNINVNTAYSRLRLARESFNKIVQKRQRSNE